MHFPPYSYPSPPGHTHGQQLVSPAETLTIPCLYMGSSTETVAFQVYEILKINHEFLQFF